MYFGGIHIFCFLLSLALTNVSVNFKQFFFVAARNVRFCVRACVRVFFILSIRVSLPNSYLHSGKREIRPLFEMSHLHMHFICFVFGCLFVGIKSNMTWNLRKFAGWERRKHHKLEFETVYSEKLTTTKKKEENENYRTQITSKNFIAAKKTNLKWHLLSRFTDSYDRYHTESSNSGQLKNWKCDVMETAKFLFNLPFFFSLILDLFGVFWNRIKFQLSAK